MDSVYEVTLNKVELRQANAGPGPGQHSVVAVGMVSVGEGLPEVGAQVVLPVVSVQQLREISHRFGRASKLRIILEE